MSATPSTEEERRAARVVRATRRRQRTRRAWLLAIGALMLLALVIAALSVSLEPGRAGLWTRIGRHCGTDELSHHLIQNPAQGQAVTACFAQAYAACHAADMMASYVQLDAGYVETYIVEPGLGDCSLADFRQHVGTGPDQRTTVHCAGMSSQPYGLHFYACGSFGDRVVLSGVDNGAPVVGTLCGPITIAQSGTVTNPASASQAGSCFAAAFQACQMATLRISQTLPPADQAIGDALLTTLLIERHGAGCEVIYLEQDTYRGQVLQYDPDVCTGLTRQTDGLHLACASRGQSVIPIAA